MKEQSRRGDFFFNLLYMNKKIRVYIIREKVILNEVNDKDEWKAFNLGNYPSIPDVIDRAKSYGFKYMLGTDGFLHTL